MNTYRAVQTVPIGAEMIVILTEQQAKTRLHNLEPLGEGRYRAVTPLQFKRGEVFGLMSALPKGHEHFVELITDPTAPSAGVPPAVDTPPSGNPPPAPPAGLMQKASAAVKKAVSSRKQKR